MAEYAMTFPRELEHNVWRDTDRELIWISIITFAITILFFGIIGSMEWKQMTAEDAQRLLDRLYQVKPAVVQDFRQSRKAEGKKEEVSEETKDRQNKLEGKSKEKVELSAAEKAAKRSAEGAARQRAAAQALSAAQSVGIFKQAGVSGSGFGGGRGSGAVAGLSSGAAAGADVRGLAGLGVSGKGAENAAKLRAGGALIEGGGGGGGRLDLTKMSSSDIEALIKRASVKVSGAPTLAGKASSAKGRASGDISRVVGGYGSNVKACFQQFLRQDPNLQGTVRFAFTVKANGSVSSVKITDSDWTDTSLGRRVENCLRERVQGWKFDAIDGAAGDLTVNYSYVFSR